MVWGWIISQTSQSPLKLLTFGGLCVIASVGIGQVFSAAVAPSGSSQPLGEQKLRDMSYEDRRTAAAREKRLSFMIRDIVDGRGDDHWNAAMRGTLVQHPEHENKTQGVDKEAIAKAAAQVAAQQRKGWWG